jgi:hypothetical protein
MKLRLALGVGALALLIVGLVAWGGFVQRSVIGRIIVVGVEHVPPFARRQDDVGALLICARRGAWPEPASDRDRAVFVHVLPFTRMLDGRGRFLTTAAHFESLRAGQRVQVWTTDDTLASTPPQVDAVKIQIDADPAEGEVEGPCS